MLSFFRILLIPLMAVLYCRYEAYLAAVVVIVISGITDILDGKIARKFNMVSDFGKFLDPLADKLTQAAMLLCLTSNHPMMLAPFILLVIKELVAAVSGLIMLRHTGNVPGADWHGKLTTLMLYGMMILHVIWQDIPLWASNTLNVGCIAMMMISMVMYTRRNILAIRSAAKGNSDAPH